MTTRSAPPKASLPQAVRSLISHCLLSIQSPAAPRKPLVGVLRSPPALTTPHCFVSRSVRIPTSTSFMYSFHPNSQQVTHSTSIHLSLPSTTSTTSNPTHHAPNHPSPLHNPSNKLPPLRNPKHRQVHRRSPPVLPHHPPTRSPRSHRQRQRRQSNRQQHLRLRPARMRI